MDAWASGAAAAPPELWGPLIKSAGMFCVVLALLLLGLYVIKRFWVEGRRVGQQGIIRSLGLLDPQLYGRYGKGGCLRARTGAKSSQQQHGKNQFKYAPDYYISGLERAGCV